MKRINKTTMLKLLPVIAASLFLSSCYKSFDPKSYAPAFTINGYSSVSEIATSSLVGYWAFDGSLVDSVSGTAGVNTGTTFTGGFKGQAMDGALASYVTATPGAAIKSLSSFTVSVWINTPAPTVGIIPIFVLARDNDFWGNIESFFENGSSNSSAIIKTHIFNGTNDHEFAVSSNIVNAFDKWTNITFTYDGAASKYILYINGSSAANFVLTAANFGPLVVTHPADLVFGAPQFMTTPSQTSTHGAESWASYNTGQLDEVRVYNKVLTAAEINALVVLQGKGK